METPYLWAFHNIRLCAELNIDDYIASIMQSGSSGIHFAIIDGTIFKTIYLVQMKWVS